MTAVDNRLSRRGWTSSLDEGVAPLFCLRPLSPSVGSTTIRSWFSGNVPLLLSCFCGGRGRSMNWILGSRSSWTGLSTISSWWRNGELICSVDNNGGFCGIGSGNPFSLVELRFAFASIEGEFAAGTGLIWSVGWPVLKRTFIFSGSSLSTKKERWRIGNKPIALFSFSLLTPVDRDCKYSCEASTKTPVSHKFRRGKKPICRSRLWNQ